MLPSKLGYYSAQLQKLTCYMLPQGYHTMAQEQTTENSVLRTPQLYLQNRLTLPRSYSFQSELVTLGSPCGELVLPEGLMSSVFALGHR